jgi:hypothetical protein
MNGAKKDADMIFRLFGLIFYILWTTKERIQNNTEEIMHVS